MSLSPGTRLGPYEVAAPLGAGGMGEVYRARDTKLKRDVAVKVLPEGLAKDAEALARFEREAVAVAALSHPNILAIFDFGKEGETAYAVMELLEGETLRSVLSGGAIPQRKAIDYAIQIAKGLAAAHEKGIVHRDLKPENLFVTKDGHVKILDFGLARQERAKCDDDTSAPTERPHTEPGTVMGTVGYMSPEQVRGEAVDHRSDIFSFGAVLYEMLSGRRAFARDTAVETMTAILREEPRLVGLGVSGTPPPLALERIVGHCLEKEPDARFQTARDLAFALAGVEGSSAASGSRVPEEPAKPSTLFVKYALAVLGGMLFAAAISWAFALRKTEAHPLFRQLTRERGTIGAARFVPGTSDALYSARWGTVGSQLYITRIDQPAPRVIPGFSGLLQSVSTSGEIMGLTNPFVSGGSMVGQLVSLPITGGASRTLAENVWTVSQGGRGEIALVIGVYAKEFRLEWPFGNVVIRSRDPLRSARLRGDRLAYFQEQGDTLEDGLLFVVDRGGKSREILPLRGFTGMAWGPGGEEIWISTFRDGQSEVAAVDLAGRTRTLLSHAGRLELQDVDSSGRALVVVNSYQRQVYARAKGSNLDEDLTWLDAQAAVGITDDGSTALLAHLGQWTNCGDGRIYLRPLDGSPALDLGEGYRIPTLSRDGKWVLTHAREPVFSIKIVPTGLGAPRLLPNAAFAANDTVIFTLPDGRHGIIGGRPEGKTFSFYSIDLETGTQTQVAPDGATWFNLQNVVSPDGKWIAYLYQDQPGAFDGEWATAFARTDGTEMTPFHGVRRSEGISGWYRDSSSIVVFDRNQIPAPVYALELRTGKRTPLLKLMPPDPVGVSGIHGVMLSLDGSAYVYNVVRQLSELYLVEGLK